MVNDPEVSKQGRGARTLFLFLGQVDGKVQVCAETGKCLCSCVLEGGNTIMQLCLCWCGTPGKVGGR